MEYLSLLIKLNCTVSMSCTVTADMKDTPLLLQVDKTKVHIPLEYEFLFPYILTLQNAPVLIDSLCDEVVKQHSFVGMTQFYRLLDYLSANRVLFFQIPGVIEMRPMTSRLDKNKPKLLPNTRYHLSRFSFMRNCGQGLCLESALNPIQINILDDRLANLITRSEGIILEDLECFNEIEKTKICNALLLFLNYMLIEPEGKEQPNLRFWEFHDLLLHGRSRAGSNVDGFGPTYRFKTPAPPALEDAPDGLPAVQLKPPDIKQYMNNSPSFFSITEHRFSHRDYSADEMNLSDLEALLYLSSRVKSRFISSNYEATSRPYPGGGALYELELYLSVNRCASLEPGVYHYSPETHALYLVSGVNAMTERLRYEAAQSAQCSNFHVLLSICARINRVMWKYEALAYSLILKDCGVFMQNFCLACSAIGLGSCILGTGSSYLLSQITGKDIYLEVPVGELVFGVPAKSPLFPEPNGGMP